VTHVVDGDTLDVDAPDPVRGKPFTRIRFWAMDTPEVWNVPKPQYYGPEASAFTKSAALGQPVRLELEPTQTRDKYNRLLAFIYLPDGRMLNAELVRQGFAYADPRFPNSKQREFARLQKEAMKDRRGLWAASPRPTCRTICEERSNCGKNHRVCPGCVPVSPRLRPSRLLYGSRPWRSIFLWRVVRWISRTRAAADWL